jgi:hypothetical protein
MQIIVSFLQFYILYKVLMEQNIIFRGLTLREELLQFFLQLIITLVFLVIYFLVEVFHFPFVKVYLLIKNFHFVFIKVFPLVKVFPRYLQMRVSYLFLQELFFIFVYLYGSVVHRIRHEYVELFH